MRSSKETEKHMEPRKQAKEIRILSPFPSFHFPETGRNMKTELCPAPASAPKLRNAKENRQEP
ncbi:hypothetical protein LEMLEM_LOCUS5311 [Lemmus lemmus]